MSNNHTTGQTVLLVEDYDDSRSVMKEALEMQGFHVVEAVNGLEAVTIAREVMPRLILMDLRMPVLDGIEAIRLIRQGEALKEVPVIIVSGDTQLSREVFLELDELGSGRIEYMRKPYALEEFLSLVQSVSEA
jgi:CheY-like chemotaxis protein